jgi:two-component system LytT family response regulator
MKVIIIEDEKPAAEKLNKALLKIDPLIEVIAMLNSVQGSVLWFEKNAMPDLVFMDIELTDGLSFRIFDRVSISCPIIFTTAYDEYWQEAFEHNSIEYLLKPIRQEKLETALAKYEKLKNHFSQNLKQLLQIKEGGSANGYKKRFLVKRGSDYVSIRSEDIAYFYAAHKLVCMVDNRNQKFILDQSLAEIEKQLDPAQFYRANRKFLVSMNSIKRMKSFPKSKLQLELEPAINEEIIISQENVAGFKEWIGG